MVEHDVPYYVENLMSKHNIIDKNALYTISCTQDSFEKRSLKLESVQGIFLVKTLTDAVHLLSTPPELLNVCPPMGEVNHTWPYSLAAWNMRYPGHCFCSCSWDC